MTEWKQLIYLTVELMICAMLVTYGVFLNNVAKTSNDIQQREANTMEILAEYREYNKFDKTLIWSQDVISTILQYRGIPIVRVKYASGVVKDYDTTLASTEYTNETLTPRFGVSSKFHATLHKDANGTIDTIVMIECRHPGDDVSKTSHLGCT